MSMRHFIKQLVLTHLLNPHAICKISNFSSFDTLTEQTNIKKPPNNFLKKRIEKYPCPEIEDALEEGNKKCPEHFLGF